MDVLQQWKRLEGIDDKQNLKLFQQLTDFGLCYKIYRWKNMWKSQYKSQQKYMVRITYVVDPLLFFCWMI